MKNERLQAVNILVQLLSEHQSLSQAFQTHHDLSPLTKNICFGVCRHYHRLERIAQSLMKKRPKQMALWVIILTGLYQLIDLDKPAYATVKETVDLLSAFKLDWAKGLTNAVLRRYEREKDLLNHTLQSDPDYQYSHPRWLYKKIQQDWPLDWQAILSVNNTHPPMSLRVNQRKTSRPAYLEKLHAQGIEATPHRQAPCGIALKQPTTVDQLPGFYEGEVSVQDEAAQLACALLDIKPHHRILDACAAPGGKTCHILESHDDITCMALDINAARLARIQENLTRLHLHATLIQGDASAPATWWDGQLFDRILLDAPCSATGVIRRHPDIKLQRTPQDIRHITHVQQQLLDALWPLLKDSGIMLYVTCSILKEENEKQIEAFLKRTPDVHIAKSHESFGQARTYGYQLLPDQDNLDLFFYSILVKKP